MDSDQMVSVIIPVYNTEKYIGEAIQSVLSQSYKNFEIIVVDDGSTDDSRNVVKSYGPSVKLLTQNHLGASAARNLGVKESRGNILAFLDADDLWTKTKLSLQMDAFMNEPALDLCFGYYETFVSPELDEVHKNRFVCPKGSMPGYIPSTLLIKKSSFMKVGFFDTQWRVGEFIDWYAKAQILRLNIKIIPEMIVKRRIHSTNQGIREKDSRIDYLRILKASLDRRRDAEKK